MFWLFIELRQEIEGHLSSILYTSKFGAAYVFQVIVSLNLQLNLLFGIDYLPPCTASGSIISRSGNSPTDYQLQLFTNRCNEKLSMMFFRISMISNKPWNTQKSLKLHGKFIELDLYLLQYDISTVVDCEAFGFDSKPKWFAIGFIAACSSISMHADWILC